MPTARTPARSRVIVPGTVQVDETYIGGTRQGKRGRGAAGKSLVVIAVQEEGSQAGRIRLQRVADASGASLQAAVQKMIEPGAVVRTDGWSGYNGLNSLGYRHEIVRKSESLGDNLLPLCNRQAGLLKRWLAGTYQGAVSPEHLEYYLDEYTFRFNRRTSTHRGKLFYRLLQNAVTTEAVTYDGIARGLRGRRRRPQHIGVTAAK